MKKACWRCELWEKLGWKHGQCKKWGGITTRHDWCAQWQRRAPNPPEERVVTERISELIHITPVEGGWHITGVLLPGWEVTEKTKKIAIKEAKHQIAKIYEKYRRADKEPPRLIHRRRPPKLAASETVKVIVDVYHYIEMKYF